MRIAVLVSAHPVDDMRVLYREAASMSEWAEVAVYGLTGCADAQVPGVRIVLVPGRGSRLWRIVVSPWVVVRRALRDGADVLHVHDPEILPAAMILTLARTTSLVFDDHENYPEVMMSKHWLPRIARRPLRLAIQAVYRLVARRARMIITPTESLAVEFRRMGAYAIVVRNFPPLNVFATSTGRNSTLRAPDYDVIHVGTLSSLRMDSFSELIREVEAVRPGTTWHFLGMSDGPIAAFDRMLPAELRNNICLSGRVGATLIPGELSRARIGLNWHPDTPQFRTAIPNKVPEYLIAGLPVVSTEIPELAEYLPKGMEGQHGLLYGDRDIPKFALALVTHLNDLNAGRTANATAISAFAASKLTWESESQTLRRGYEESIDRVAGAEARESA